jgi:hypothetical protein
MRMRFERAFLLVSGVFAFGTGVTERPATRSDLCQSSFNGNYLSMISRTGDVETFADEGFVGPAGIAVNAESELFVVN